MSKSAAENVEATKNIATSIFANSRKIIDDKLGDGYSVKNPALLASVISLQEKIYSHIATQH